VYTVNGKVQVCSRSCVMGYAYGEYRDRFVVIVNGTQIEIKKY